MSGPVLFALGSIGSAVGILAGAAASAVRRVDLYRWAAGRQPGASAAANLLHAPDRIVRTAKALATAGVVLVGTGLAAAVARVPVLLQIALVALVAVPLLLVLGYAVPRALGRRWPEGIVRRTVPWLQRLAGVLSPVYLRGLVSAEEGEEQKPESLSSDVAPGPELELTALSGVVAFTERPLREVMTPRTEIVAVREGASVEDVARRFMEAGYSRLPLYRESLDNVVGMVYAFDLLKITPGAVMPVRPIATAPASKRSAELLFEMQRDRRQVAIVLDEFGGTAGMVTLEDLLEELLGEIFDEHDGSTEAASAARRTLEAPGTVPVEDVEAGFGVALPHAAETVGGMLARLVGRIPVAGERFAVGGLEFDVLAANPNRVERVFIRRTPVSAVRLEQGEAE